MFKKYFYLFVLLVTLQACGQKKAVLYSETENIIPVVNIPLTADDFLADAAADFVKNFKIITNADVKIERSNGLNDDNSYVLLRINPTQDQDFCVLKKGDNITIQGKDYKNLMFGINDFFDKYTALNYRIKKEGTVIDSIVNRIEVPKQFNYCSSPDFEYREPYFSDNFTADFRNWHKTNYLELEWGIWGHNLPKILKDFELPEAVYATVNGKITDEQFCFTSERLFEVVNIKVSEIFESDNNLNKFMILPNDNNLVCTCNTCSKAGNTKTNASPAVFQFLNKLAKNHKQSRFFTAAYNSVKKVPKFDAEKNVGVFYSTIDVQKGIPIEKSEFAEEFTTAMKYWGDYVNDLYVWDYTVNFDNYFDLYPSLSVTKQNLKLYKSLGVRGVFMHGSEYKYSTFQELKASILAKLMWDIETDVEKEISIYFNEKYSKKLAGILTNYYTFVDEAFLESKKPLSIYSGINQTTRKYLDPKVFFEFYNEFDLYTQNNQFDKEYLKIATALTFLKLEIMRDYGYGEYGFAELNNNNEIIVKNEVGDLLDKLSVYKKSADLEVYNEAKLTLSEYIDNWRKAMYRFHKRKHYFFKKPFEVISKMDEDYQNKKVLNDGAFGLNDYNTNWHIVTVDDLVLKIDKKEIAKSTKITMSFLQDVKHDIFYPSVISILTTKNKVIKKYTVPIDKDFLNTKEITIDLPTKLDDEALSETFILKIEKQTVSGKNALACDEIIFH